MINWLLIITLFVNMNKSTSPIERKGYLIYNEDFHILKKLLNYRHYNTYVKHRKNFDIKSLFNENDIKKIEKLEPIKITSLDYIKNKIKYNDKDFIIITENLIDLINNEHEKPIKFTAQKEKVILVINYKDKLELNHNNLILSLPVKASEDDEIKNIYDSMLKYFLFEKNFIKQLKENKKKSYSGFLVGKNWLDKWKKYTNYDEIKEKYLVNNYYNMTKDIKKSLFNEIIDYKEINKKIYLLPSENESLKNINEHEIINMLKKNQLALIDLGFKNFFPYLDSKAIKINYQLCNGEITI